MGAHAQMPHECALASALRVHSCMCMQLHLHECMNAGTGVLCTCVLVLACLCVCMCACVCVCMCVCMCTCMWACTCPCATCVHACVHMFGVPWGSGLGGHMPLHEQCLWQQHGRGNMRHQQQWQWQGWQLKVGGCCCAQRPRPRVAPRVSRGDIS